MEFIKRTVSFIFSALIIVVGLIIATPLFILSVLLNWMKLGIAFSIFWLIVCVFYYTFFVSTSTSVSDVFNNTSLLWITLLSLIGSIYVTVAQVRE